MPKVPDASSVTRLRAITPAVVPDPTKRSASFVPSQTSLLSSLRTTTQGQAVYPGQSLLSTSVTRGYVNPRHQGYVTSPTPTPTPFFLIDGGGFDFINLVTRPVFEYYFGAAGPEDGAPPASTFQVAFTNFANLPWVEYAGLSDLANPGRDLLGGVSISIAQEWPGNSFTANANTPAITTEYDEVFPTNAVLTVTGAPTGTTGIAIVLKGPGPPAPPPP
jgi:hypothetical protein